MTSDNETPLERFSLAFLATWRFNKKPPSLPSKRKILLAALAVSLSECNPGQLLTTTIL